jgi:hypothetical protein
MSTLPLISHRLFVAAVRTEDNSPEKSDRNEAAKRNSEAQIAAIPLEILNSGKPMPPRSTAWVQASIRATA